MDASAPTMAHWIRYLPSDSFSHGSIKAIALLASVRREERENDYGREQAKIKYKDLWNYSSIMEDLLWD